MPPSCQHFAQALSTNVSLGTCRNGRKVFICQATPCTVRQTSSLKHAWRTHACVRRSPTAVKIVLKGGDQAAIRAAELIQDRIAGPPKQHVQAEVVARQIIVWGSMPVPPKLPDEVLAIEQARYEAEERAQMRRGAVS